MDDVAASDLPEKRPLPRPTSGLAKKDTGEVPSKRPLPKPLPKPSAAATSDREVKIERVSTAPASASAVEIVPAQRKGVLRKRTTTPRVDQTVANAQPQSEPFDRPTSRDLQNSGALGTTRGAGRSRSRSNRKNPQLLTSRSPLRDRSRSHSNRKCLARRDMVRSRHRSRSPQPMTTRGTLQSRSRSRSNLRGERQSTSRSPTLRISKRARRSSACVAAESVAAAEPLTATRQTTGEEGLLNRGAPKPMTHEDGFLKIAVWKGKPLLVLNCEEIANDDELLKQGMHYGSAICREFTRSRLHHCDSSSDATYTNSKHDWLEVEFSAGSDWVEYYEVKDSGVVAAAERTNNAKRHAVLGIALALVAHVRGVAAKWQPAGHSVRFDKLLEQTKRLFADATNDGRASTIGSPRPAPWRRRS